MLSVPSISSIDSENMNLSYNVLSLDSSSTPSSKSLGRYKEFDVGIDKGLFLAQAEIDDTHKSTLDQKSYLLSPVSFKEQNQIPKQSLYSENNDMYPMYQTPQSHRRHSTIDSTNNGDVEYPHLSPAPIYSDHSHSLDVENKIATMSHFENSSFFQNYFMSKGSILSESAPTQDQSFQPFYSIKPVANQQSLYSDSGSLLSLPKKISLYKTELCRTFEETGFCRYGIKCQFAHDKSELRIIPRHPRYKTEICRTFWELGNCPYGKRCCFIHLEAGTLMNGKPPGQAKIISDNQFNGPAQMGFQRDQLVKSKDTLIGTSFKDELHKIPNAKEENPIGAGLCSDQSFALPNGFDWMRTRRSQSFSLPSSRTTNWGSFNYSVISNLNREKNEDYNSFLYNKVENSDYTCETCSVETENSDSHYNYLTTEALPILGDKKNTYLSHAVEEESTESIMADSLLASLPDL